MCKMYIKIPFVDKIKFNFVTNVEFDWLEDLNTAVEETKKENWGVYYRASSYWNWHGLIELRCHNCMCVFMYVLYIQGNELAKCKSSGSVSQF